MTEFDRSVEHETLFAHNVTELVEQELTPLFAREPGWKPAAVVPQKLCDEEYALGRPEQRGVVYYDRLLKVLSKRNADTPVIVEAATAVRKGGLPWRLGGTPDEVVRYFLDRAAEMSVTAISDADNQTRAKGAYLGEHERNLYDRKLAQDPNGAVVALRQFQGKLREKVPPAPQQSHK